MANSRRPDATTAEDLLARGASPNACCLGAANATALHVAVRRGNDAIVAVLLDAEAEVDVRDAQGRTPLHYAASYESVESADLLLGRGADVNVVDFDGLHIHAPEMVYDLPAEGRRLVQKIDGYKYTIKSGEVTFEDGEPTGALPGRLVRGPQAAPSS